jgi:hypothetical protein
MHRQALVAAGLLLGALLAGAALFGDANSSCALAQGNACASACRSAYSDCRIATKGSSSCDAQYQACLRGCARR